MPKSRPPYPLKFRRRMVELVRAGRMPEELSREFEPSAQAIHNWVNQADLDEGKRKDGLTTLEREELARLRRENKQLRLEPDAGCLPQRVPCVDNPSSVETGDKRCGDDGADPRREGVGNRRPLLPLQIRPQTPNSERGS